MNFTREGGFDAPRDPKIPDLEYLRAWARGHDCVIYTPSMELMSERSGEFVGQIASYGFVGDNFRVVFRSYKPIHSVNVTVSIDA